MNTEALIAALKLGPVDFSTVMAVIDTEYDFSPTAFRNGDQLNEAGSNSGSCKIFAFAALHDLNQQATLNAFGDYYHQDVLTNPGGSDHANIRNFMRSGWQGVVFDKPALTAKPSL